MSVGGTVLICSAATKTCTIIAQSRRLRHGAARQQAGVAYEKSVLRGRTELAAFFLHDPMLPDEERTGARSM
jgi:hypothetical protein